MDNSALETATRDFDQALRTIQNWVDWTGVKSRAVIDWLGIDVSAPTMTKYGILVVAVWLLIWFLGRIYRGELQNQSVEVDIIQNHRTGYYTRDDVLFTKQTMDIKTAKVSGTLTITYLFALGLGEKRLQKRTRVKSGHYRLRMQNAGINLGHGQLAFATEVEGAIKNAAEHKAREAARSANNTLSRRLTRMFGTELEEITIHPGHYEVRVRFTNDIIFGPIFLLFRHPDSEVKATGWLTLLTSLFAVLAQFLFQAAHPAAQTDRPESPARIHLSSGH